MSGKKKEGVGESSAVPRLDLANVRIKAAMRILGISAEHLQPKPTPRGEPSSPLAAKRLDVLEQKRLELVAEVEATADSLHQEDAELILMPSKASDDRMSKVNLTSEVVLEKEQAKLAALKKRTKEEVQRLVSDELWKSQRQLEGARKGEESRQRLAQIRNEKKAELDLKKKELMEKEAHKQENLRKMNEHRAEEVRALQQKMANDTARVNEVLRQNKGRFDYKKEIWRNKMDGINQRREEAREESRQNRIRQLEELENKLDMIVDRAQERLDAKQARSSDQQAVFAQRVVQLVQDQNDNQAAKEAAYRDRLEKMQAMRDEVARKNAERSKELKEKEAQKAEVVQKNLDALDAIHKEKAREMAEKIRKDAAGSNRREVMAEESAKRRGQRDLYRELFLSNKERMNASDEYAREQTLQKINTNVDRVNGVLSARRGILEQRAQTLKDMLLEKDHLHEVMNSMQSASPRKVTQLLKSLDMAPVGDSQTEEKKEEK